jgi:hypothetical protein
VLGIYDSHGLGIGLELGICNSHKLGLGLRLGLGFRSSGGRVIYHTF